MKPITRLFSCLSFVFVLWLASAEQVVNTLTTTSPLDTFAVTKSQYQQGGTMTWITNASQLLDTTSTGIPVPRRQAGMMVPIGTNLYQLASDLTTWVLQSPYAPTSKIVSTISELTNSSPSFLSANSFGTNSSYTGSVNLLGRAAIGDGGGGTFILDATDTTTPVDNGMVFADAATGKRYKRQWSGEAVNSIWFGADPSGTTDSTEAIQAAINFASNPTYGPKNNTVNSGGKVFTPAGLYRITQLRMTNLAEFYGVASPVQNADLGTTFRQTNFFVGDAIQIYGNPFLHQFRLYGQSEDNVTNVVAVTGVTSRSQFTVATNTLPTFNAAGASYPYYGHCWFYDSNTNYMGSGWVQTINFTSGLVTLRTNSDLYATFTTNSGLLDTSTKVIFTPLSTVGSHTGYYSAKATAGNVGICHKTSGYVRLDTVKIQKFFVGMLNESVGTFQVGKEVYCLACQLASFAQLYPGSSSDNLFTEAYFQGYYSRSGLVNPSFTTNLDNNLFRRCTYGVLWPGSSDQYIGITMDSPLIGCLQSSALDVFWKPFFSDNVTVGAYWIEGVDGGGSAVNIDQFQFRPLFVTAGAEFAQVPTNSQQTFGLKITGGSSASIGMLTARKVYSFINNAGVVPVPSLTNLFDIESGSTTRLNLLGRNVIGVVANLKATNTVTPFIANRWTGGETATDAGFNWYYPTAGGTYYSLNGVQMVDIESTGITLSDFAVTGPALTIRGGVSQSPILRLRRNSGATNFFDFTVSTDLLRIINSTDGSAARDALNMNIGASSHLYYLGSAGNPATPANATLLTESATGTNVSAGNFNLQIGGSTGSATPGTFSVTQTVPGVSGASAQSRENRFSIDTNGATVISGLGTSQSVAATSVGFDMFSTTKGMRIFRMTAAQRDAIVSPASGLIVCVTDDHETLNSYDGTSWRQLYGGWRGFAILDFPSISAGASSDLTITVTGAGATASEGVVLGLPAAPNAGIVFTAFVSGSNTVTVRATNVTLAPIDPASATYRAFVYTP